MLQMRKPRFTEVKLHDHSNHTRKWHSQDSSTHALSYYSPCYMMLCNVVGKTGAYIKKKQCKAVRACNDRVYLRSRGAKVKE